MRDFVICLSASNLLFLESWHLLQQRGIDFYRRSAPSDSLLWVTVADVLAFGFASFAVVQLARRGGEAWQRVVKGAFLLMLTVPVNSAQALLVLHSRLSWVAMLARFCLCALGAFLIIAAVWVIAFRAERTVKVARECVFILAALVPLVVLMTVRGLAMVGPAAFAETSVAEAAAPYGGASRRVLLFVFDEFDENLAFDGRPAGVSLPELDRFRRESIYASRAQPPAGSTVASMASIVTGQQVIRATPEGANRLELDYFGRSGELRPGAGSTLFSRVRSLGLNAVVVGWYLPYCRLFGVDLVDCSWQPAWMAQGILTSEAYLRRYGVGAAMAAETQMRLRFLPLLGGIIAHDVQNRRELLEREQQVKAYRAIHSDALRAAMRDDVGFLMVHWPIPHVWGIYDRRLGELTTSRTSTYLDNMALVDRTITDFRIALAQAGEWNRTTVIITGDHFLRYSVWDGKKLWTDEESRHIHARHAMRVPFLVKLAGQDEGISYGSPLNTVVIHDLVLALLSGDVPPDPREVVHWLHRQE